MKDKICIIAGASAIVKEDFLYFYNECLNQGKEVLLIGADAGYKFLLENQMQADLVVGDFDSFGSVPEHEHIIKHPVMKDDTDMLLAIKEGFKRGCQCFLLFGGLGRRMDHSIANISLLGYIKKQGGCGYLLGEDMHMTMVKNEKVMFDSSFTGIFSAFAFGDEVREVSLTGFKYELHKACIRNDFPIGVSNEFVGKESVVCVEEGELLIMWESVNKKVPIFL